MTTISRFVQLAGLLALAVAALAFIISAAPASHAASECSLIRTGQSVPQGFGVPYDTQSSAAGLLIRAMCEETAATLHVGTGRNVEYIYEFGYEWTGSSWSRKSLSGSNKTQNWYVGSATMSLPHTSAEMERTHYAIAYVCAWHGSQAGWKCGCRDAACTTAHWQLQAFKYVPGAANQTGFKRIASEAELREYVDASANSGSFNRTVSDLSGGAVREDTAVGAPAPQSGEAAGADSDGGAQTASRFSETNVQVEGIDEPDYVKTDGSTIYISRQLGHYWGRPFVGGGVAVEPAPTDPAERDTATDDGGTTSGSSGGGTSGTSGSTDAASTKALAPDYYRDDLKTLAVDAFPLSSLGIASESIEERGELLLIREHDILVILSHPSIVAYDISDPASPVKEWSFDLENNTNIVAARLTGGDVYQVTQSRLDRGRPCPVRPLSQNGVTIAVPCTDIWVPERVEPASVTYSIFRIDPTTGEADGQLTFAGDGQNTVISVFPDNLYLTYRLQSALSEVMIEFYRTGLTDLLPASTVTRINTIASYDISDQSKLVEIQTAVKQATVSMDSNERLQFNNEVQNKLKTYLDAHIRETDRTAIARVPLSSLSIAATGEVPGHLLNQFSLDEHEGHLRLATTIGDRWRTETRNDVYVLDMNLEETGSIEDLGLTERIYAARFLGDEGYLVTFRQIDPFYVLDLSDPDDPQMTGELKIPGFSSYLEPIDEDTILGVGQEDRQVKLSLFDVSDPTNPTERSKYTLAEHWTEVNQNHHAFLKDDRHEIFFLPGGQGGYVFSYEDGDLALKKAIKGYGIRRAVYIDDYLYLIGDSKITVLDENTWAIVDELTLD